MYFAFSLLTVTIVVCCLLFVTLLYIPLLWLLWFTEVHWQASVMSGWQIPRWSQLVQQELFPLQVLIAKLFFWSLFFLFSVCKSIPSAQNPLFSKYLTVCQAYYQHNLLSSPSLVSFDCSNIFWSLLLKQQCVHLPTQIAQNPLILKTLPPFYFEVSSSSYSVHICLKFSPWELLRTGCIPVHCLIIYTSYCLHCPWLADLS